MKAISLNFRVLAVGLLLLGSTQAAFPMASYGDLSVYLESLEPQDFQKRKTQEEDELVWQKFTLLKRNLKSTASKSAVLTTVSGIAFFGAAASLLFGACSVNILGAPETVMNTAASGFLAGLTLSVIVGVAHAPLTSLSRYIAEFNALKPLRYLEVQTIIAN